MTPITNLSEDDRSLIMWDVREWCDTYEMYNPGHRRRHLIRSCFSDLRRWMQQHAMQSAPVGGGEIRWALLELERQRNLIPEIFEQAQSAEAAYWHRAPRSWE